jgi:hypothetical protein
MKSNLDTVTLRAELSKNSKMTFFIDTGAEISVVRNTSLKPEYMEICEHDYFVKVKGIYSTVLETEGTINIRLTTESYETTHFFHIMGNSLELQCDGILGRDFWQDRKATINYCDREVIIEGVVIKFDPPHKDTDWKLKKLTLRARSENYVKLPTSSTGIGLTEKQEISPGIYLAESITSEINGLCVTSIINMLEEDVTIDYPQVNLEDVEDTDEPSVMIFSTAPVEDEGSCQT